MNTAMTYVNTFGGGVAVGMVAYRYLVPMIGSAADNLWRNVVSDVRNLWSAIRTPAVKPAA